MDATRVPMSKWRKWWPDELSVGILPLGLGLSENRKAQVLGLYVNRDFAGLFMTFAWRLLVGISPALIIGTLFSQLMAVIVVMAASGGRRVYPRDFIGHMLVSWLVIPVGAALLGTLPLLGASSITKEAGSR
jgi:hypothetical protein